MIEYDQIFIEQEPLIYLQKNITGLFNKYVKLICKYKSQSGADLLSVNYFHDGKYHREDGPAEFFSRVDGKRTIINYYDYGMLHRDDGPASLTLNSFFRVESCNFFLKDKSKSRRGLDLQKPLSQTEWMASIRGFASYQVKKDYLIEKYKLDLTNVKPKFAESLILDLILVEDRIIALNELEKYGL